MELYVTGGYRKLRADADSLGSFLGYYLMKPRLASTLSVEIILNKHLERNTGLVGSVDYDSEGNRPKSFYIEVDSSQEYRDIMITLCHEFVHVMQYATGRLKELVRHPSFRFDGNYFNCNSDYYKHPWEIEAYNLENDLYNRWKYGI